MAAHDGTWLVLALVAAAGCLEAVPPQDFVYATPEARADANRCGGVWGVLPEACGTCLHEQCCAASTACAADPGCRAHLACVRACRYGTCYRSCAAPTKSALALSNAVTDCRFDKCAGPCQLGLDWSCVGQVAYPTAKAGKVARRFHVLDALSQEPVVGALVQACTFADLACSTPLAATTVTADGAELLMADGFQGVLRVTATGYPPHLQVRADPLLGLSPQPWDVNLIAKVPLVTLLDTIGAPWSESLGFIFAYVLDCQGSLAPGVQLHLAPLDTAAGFYLVGPLPSTEARKTEKVAVGGFAHVKPGLPTLSARLASDGRTVGKMVIPVQAGTVTLVSPISPTP